MCAIKLFPCWVFERAVSNQMVDRRRVAMLRACIGCESQCRANLKAAKNKNSTCRMSIQHDLFRFVDSSSIHASIDHPQSNLVKITQEWMSIYHCRRMKKGRIFQWLLSSQGIRLHARTPALIWSHDLGGCGYDWHALRLNGQSHIDLEIRLASHSWQSSRKAPSPYYIRPFIYKLRRFCLLLSSIFISSR